MRNRRVEIRKVHHQKSKIGSLTEDQRAKLQSWFVNDEISYAEASKRIKEQFGVEIGSTSLGNWFHLVCTPIIIQREQAKKGVTAEIVVRVAGKPVAIQNVPIATIEPLTNHEHTTRG